MTIPAGVVRRVVSALVIGAVAVGVFAWQPLSSGPKLVAASAPLDPLRARHPAPAEPDPTTTTVAPEPEPEPEPAPAPAPAPKKKATAPAPQSSPKAANVSGSDAAQLISLVNQYRAANGLPALAKASDATAKAQQHSNDMAAQGRMSHSSSMSSGISPGWSSLGENVGVGGSASQVESMFENSGPHRANHLNESFTQIGVGVTIGDDGQMYVTEVFVGR
ncbi:MAG: hypothetical protein QOG30_1111 [Acidimicrobiaceae bacterium]